MGCLLVQSYTVAMDTQKNLIAQIAGELKLPAKQIGAAVSLLQDGNTIPFIARYRKEATQSLNEIQLRQIEDALERINALAARKSTVIKSIQVLTFQTKTSNPRHDRS